MPEVQEEASLEVASKVAVAILKVLNDADIPYDINTAIAFSMLSSALAKEMGANEDAFAESSRNIFKNIKEGVLFQKQLVVPGKEESVEELAKKAGIILDS